MARVYFPDAGRLTKLEFAAVAHVPVIFNSSWKYEREINWYLRDRALLRWHPNADCNPVTRKIDYPRPNTLKNFAHQLKNFLEWCEQHHNDWRALTYGDVLEYQREMEIGRWSSDGEPLEAPTANQRADTATHFLCWAASRSLRAPLGHPTARSGRIISGYGSSGHHRVVLEGRPGRVKQLRNKTMSRLTMIPSATEIRDWLAAVRRRRGYAKYLACRFIIETGVRRNEVSEALETALPSVEELHELATRGLFTAPMNLEETKGGRPREIQIPIPFALELRKWAETRRLKLIWDYRKRTGKPAANVLFLSDSPGHQGVPTSPATIYQCFKVEKPSPRWSPHKGRHTFACCYVLHAMEFEARIVGKAVMDMSSGWIIERGSWWIATLRRQLGHISQETTDLYLRWLLTTARVSEAACGWHKFLNGE